MPSNTFGFTAADRAAGLANVTVRTYPQARHEILNEINNAEVIAAMASWVDRVLSSAGPPRACPVQRVP